MGKTEVDQRKVVLDEKPEEHYARLVDKERLDVGTPVELLGRIAVLCEQSMQPLCELGIRQDTGDKITEVDKLTAIRLRGEVKVFRILLGSLGQEGLLMAAEERARQKAQNHLQQQ